MQYDLSIVLVANGSANRLVYWVERFTDLLLEKIVTHEFVIVDPSNSGEIKETLKKLTTDYHNVKALSIEETIAYESSLLCASAFTQSKYTLVIPANVTLQLKDLYACYVAITKSNIDILYAFQPSNRTIFKIPSFFFRQIFSVLSGLSVYRSNTFIYQSKLADDLRIKTPYFFLFDKLIKQKAKVSFHLDVKSKTPDKITEISRFYLIKQFLANSLALELMIILFLSVNIFILLEAKLLMSFILACISFLLIGALYALKWRRRIAYKILERFD